MGNLKNGNVKKNIVFKGFGKKLKTNSKKVSSAALLTLPVPKWHNSTILFFTIFYVSYFRVFTKKNHTFLLDIFAKNKEVTSANSATAGLQR